MQANPQNRPLSQINLEKYRSDIRAGTWLHNGETVIVSDTGELNDGQHRCIAVVGVGKSIVTEMTFGVARDSRSTVDIGHKKTVGQHLAMAGHLNAKPIGKASALILTFREYGRITRSPDMAPTTSDIMAFAATHPDLQDDVTWGSRARKKFRVSQGLYTALHFLFCERSPDDANRFFAALIDGASLAKSSPIYRLREMLIRNSHAKAKLPETEIAALTIKAWNQFRRGQTRQSLVWRTSGSAPEIFPIPE